MPKCTICGKKFDTLAALRDHHRSVHPKSRFVAEGSRLSRNLIVAMVIVIVAIGGGVGYLIYSTSLTGNSHLDTSLFGTPISSGLYQNLTTVSYSTLSSIGSGQTGVTPPTSISNSVTLTSGGKSEILYIGAEFCPYCAAERWSLVIALSKFGNFTGLDYMASAQDDGDISTLTFYNASYSSQYNVTFITVENEDRNHATLQTPTSNEQNLWNEYNANNYPFIDIGGMYILKSSQYGINAISNLNWTQIGSQLNNPQSSVAKLVDGSANQLIGAICNIDGQQPSSLCGQSFANVSFAIGTPSATQTSSLLLVETLPPDTLKR
jgi:hypothetical protein